MSSNVTVNSTPINLDVTNEIIALSIESNQYIISVSGTTIDFSVVSNPIELSVESSEIALSVESNPVVLEFNTGNVTINTNGGGGKISVEYDYTDYGGNVITIGQIPADSLIVNTVIENTVAFNSGTLTVGIDTAQALLMAIADRGNAQDRYLTNNYLQTNSTDTYKVFFSGSPSQGSGKIYITYL